MRSLVVELGSFLNFIIKNWQLSKFLIICLCHPEINAKRASIYTNRVSNDSIEYNLFSRYKFNALIGSKMFIEAQILPLLLQKLMKMNIFYRKFTINYYFKLQFDSFYIERVK